MKFGAWILLLACCLSSAAKAENAAEVMDRIADKYCRDAGGSYEKSRQSIAAKGITDDYPSDAEAAVFTVAESNLTFLLTVGRMNLSDGLFEQCKVLSAYETGIEAVAAKTRARNLPTRSRIDGDTQIDFMLSADERTIFAKSFAYKRDEAMSISYARFPASQRGQFVGGRPAGSVLEQERLRDAAITSMKCRLGDVLTEVQMSDGKAAFGAETPEDLEMTGSEIAFKVKGAVYYFDFGRKFGRRSTPAGTQKIDCF
jgi:hypothetical protein